MSNTKISALGAGTALAGTEEIPAVQSAATVKITPAQIKTFTSASPTLAAGTTALPSMKLTAGTNLTTAEAGPVEYDGKAMYSSMVASARGVVPSVQFASNAAAVTLPNDTNANPIFPSANDAITLASSTSYFMEAVFVFSTGNTSHNVTCSLGGTATFTSIKFSQLASVGTAFGGNTCLLAWSESAAGSLIANGTATKTRVVWSGVVRVDAGGTVIPSVAFSADPTGTCQMESNCFIRFTPIGSNTVEAVGNWA